MLVQILFNLLALAPHLQRHLHEARSTFHRVLSAGVTINTFKLVSITHSTPPPTHTVPWPTPGTPTVSAAYQTPLALWLVLSFIVSLGSAAVFLVLLKFCVVSAIRQQFVKLLGNSKSNILSWSALICSFSLYAADKNRLSCMHYGDRVSHLVRIFSTWSRFASLECINLLVATLNGLSTFAIFALFNAAGNKSALRAILDPPSPQSIEALLEALLQLDALAGSDALVGPSDNPHQFWHNHLWKTTRMFDSAIRPIALRSVGDLAFGAFGDVKKVADQDTGRLYAVKRVRGTRRDKKGSRVWSEVSVHLLMADHPAFPDLHSVFRDSQAFYVLMDLGGQPFTSFSLPLPFETSIYYSSQLVLGLHALHRHGIVHSDIKHNNLLLGPDGHLRIIDFGLAQDLYTSEPDPSKYQRWTRLRDKDTDAFPMLWPCPDNPHITDAACGTLGFECAQIRLGQEYSYGGDLWSFGVVMHGWLTGEMPDFYFNEDTKRVWWVHTEGVEYQHEVSQFFERIFAIEPGCRFESYEGLKRHAIWGPVPDWKALEERRARLPPQPELLPS